MAAVRVKWWSDWADWTEGTERPGDSYSAWLVRFPADRGFHGLRTEQRGIARFGVFTAFGAVAPVWGRGGVGGGSEPGDALYTSHNRSPQRGSGARSMLIRFIGRSARKLESGVSCGASGAPTLCDDSI